jgi:iron-sulfur cluster repair protein YtfE (RIC family)
MSTYRHIRFHHIEESDQLDFIESKYHAFSRAMLDLMGRNFRSALRSNPKWKSEIQDLICLIDQIQEQLNTLIELEQKNLFPFIRKLAEVEQHQQPLKFLKVKLVESSINSIKLGHNHVVALLHSIKVLSNEFQAPRASNELLKLCYAELQEFDNYILKSLAHKENYLFPKILQLELKVLFKTKVAPAGMGAIGRDD